MFDHFCISTYTTHKNAWGIIVVAWMAGHGFVCRALGNSLALGHRLALKHRRTSEVDSELMGNIKIDGF